MEGGRVSMDVVVDVVVVGGVGGGWGASSCVCVFVDG